MTSLRAGSVGKRPAVGSSLAFKSANKICNAFVEALSAINEPNCFISGDRTVIEEGGAATSGDGTVTSGDGTVMSGNCDVR